MRGAQDYDRVEIFRGPGSRKRRVHLFDQKTGCYLTRGYLKDHTLFVKEPILLHEVELRSFRGKK